MVKALFGLTSCGGKKVKTEPNLGITENPTSTIAASKAAQVIDLLDFTLENNAENSFKVEALTLKTGTGSAVTGSAGLAGSGWTSVTDECTGRVFAFPDLFPTWTFHSKGERGSCGSFASGSDFVACFFFCWY